MLSVAGFYDGNSVVLSEPIALHKKCKVIITFLEETDTQDEAEKLRNFGAENNAFDFWNNPSEDIYEDYSDRK